MYRPSFTHFATLTVFIFGLLLFYSCENSEAYLVDYSIDAFTESIEIVDSSAEITIRFPDSVTSANNIITNFIISEDASLHINGVPQKSGESRVNYEAPFSFQVVSENEKTVQNWHVQPFNNNTTESWGLGGFVSTYISNDRPYEWYIDQGDTGPFSGVNCAPTSIVMACKWIDEEFSYTVQDARSMYNPQGGGWYTSDIDNCLTDFNIEHDIIELATSWEETAALISNQIDEGNLVMLCIDIHYLQHCSDQAWHVDRYYKTIQLGFGHCIIIKGYMIVDGTLYFEIYDPIGYNYKYSDGQFKGKDRYYRSKDIFTATFGWWNYAFTISSSTKTKKGELPKKRIVYKDILIL